MSTYQTSDLAIAAYLKMKGLKLKKAERMHGNSNKFYFVFDDPKNIGDELKIEFANSECQEFDSAIGILKSMTYSSRR